jgi:hypothetical protein
MISVARSTSTPSALNVFNAQYAHARADWVALSRYDYADYWTARADADIAQRAVAADALADYDTALADARVGYTTTVAAAVAARQMADAQSDADYASDATARAGTHSVAAAGAEKVLQVARAEAVGSLLISAAEAALHTQRPSIAREEL